MKKAIKYILIVIFWSANLYSFEWHIDQSYFIENMGQWDSTVKFISKSNVGEIQIINSGIKYKLDSSTTITSTFVNSNWVSNNNINFTKDIPGKATYNFYLGSDSNKWRTDVSTFNQLTVKSLYSRINLKLLFIDTTKFRYDFLVYPGGNPNSIKMKFNGADSIKVDSSSTGFTVYNRADNLINSGLKAFQFVSDTIRYISCTFVKNTDTTISFVLGTYDTTKLLIIDPIIASEYIGLNKYNEELHCIKSNDDNTIYMSGITNWWSKYDILLIKYETITSNSIYCVIGSENGDDGPGHDGIIPIALDQESNVYLTGIIKNDDFPLTENSYKTTNHTPSNSAFFMKLNRNFNKLIFSGYYSIQSYDDLSTRSIVVDHTGDIFILGDFNVSGTNIYLAKINSDGSELIFDKIISGDPTIPTHNAFGMNIAIKSNNSILINGYSHTKLLINGEYYNRLIANDNNHPFLFELSNDGSKVINYIYFGGNGTEGVLHLRCKSAFRISKMVLDENDYAYLTGETDGTDYWEDIVSNQRNQIFLIKINTNDFNIEFKKVFGSYNDDFGTSLTLDKNNNIYVLGHTHDGLSCKDDTHPFPITTNYHFYNDCDNVVTNSGIPFLTIFSNDGSKILISSYLRKKSNVGTGTYGMDICVDRDNKVYIAGITNQPDLPLAKWRNMSAFMASKTDGFFMILTPFPEPVIVK